MLAITTFHFDKEREMWVCPRHGDVGDNAAWVRCWNGCDDGWFDEYEDDPINCDPGDLEPCSECRGEGGWVVCGPCNIDNPDAEF